MTAGGEPIRALAMAIATWVGLALWWRISVAVNAEIDPRIPIFLVLTFGALLLARRFIFYSVPLASQPYWIGERIFLAANTFLGIIVCLGTAFLCFVFSNTAAGEASADESLRGLAAPISAYSFPIYIAAVEEAAFRSQLQRRLAPSVGKFQSILIAGMIFVAIHWRNVAFHDFWAMYISIAVVCGFLAADFRSIIGAIMVHASLNLAGVSFAPWLNREVASLTTGGVRTAGIVCLAVTVVLFFVSRALYLNRRPQAV